MKCLSARALAVMLLCLVITTKTYALDYRLNSDSDFFTLGAGLFDVTEPDDISFVGLIDYRFSPRIFSGLYDERFHGAGLMAGILANTDSGFYGFGGLFLDIRWNEKIFILPSLSVGGYGQNHSRDLGGVLEFKPEFYIGYKLSPQNMVGLSLQHISNGGFHRKNPGVNMAIITWTFGAF